MAELVSRWARKSAMGVIIFAALFGAAITASFVQLTARRSQSFSLRRTAASGFVAVVFVVAVSTIVAYFLTRVHIGDHYEANSILMAVLVVRPATVGAVLGAVGGGLMARYTLATRHD